MKKINIGLIHRAWMNWLFILPVIWAFILPVQVIAQTNQQTDNLVKGKVLDSKGIPLPGVTIMLSGTSLGVSSDQEGNFALRISQKSGLLEFSFIGFKKQQVPFQEGQSIVVKLQEDVANLEEVQVVGYRTQRKRDATGALSVIKADQFDGLTTNSLDNMLQGKVPGLNIVSSSGAPAARNITRLRGDNGMNVESTRRFPEPLWIIDDVPLNTSTSSLAGTSPLATIDPAIVESVTVLKDAAAAALYGSRAANGVIIVTTRQGIIQEPRFSFKISHSISCRPTLLERTGGKSERQFRLDALNNYQRAIWDEELGQYRYMESMWDSYVNQTDYGYFWNNGQGNEALILTDSLNPFYHNSTNFLKEFFQLAHTTSASIGINGGNEYVSGNASLGYFREKGVLTGTGFERVNANFNLKMRVHQKIESNMRMYLAYVKRDRSGKGFNMFTGSIDPDLDKIPEFLLTTSSLLPGPGSEFWDDLTAKYGQAMEKNDSYRLRGSFDLKYEIIPGLSAKSMVAVDFGQNNQNIFLPSTVDANNESTSSGQVVRNITLLNENFLTYKRSFNESMHKIDFLLGLTFQTDKMHSIGGMGRRAPSDKIHYVTWNDLVYDGDDPLKNYRSNYEAATSVGVLTSLNYNLLDKYLISGSIRWDASSKFGEDVRWGRFPAIALGWIFSDESFMDWSRDVLDYGKLRVSYGLSGRQFDQPYISFGVLEAGTPYQGHPTIQPVSTDGLMNRKLTWEVTKQLNIGLDMDFFKHRFNMVFDFYHKYTDDLLYKVTIPGNYTGYDKQWQNAFGILNQGIELALNGDIILNKNWRWNVSFNIARNWNMLKKSTDRHDFNPDTPLGLMETNINVVGKPLNSLYVYRDNGIYDNQSQVPGVFVGDRYTPLQGKYGNEFYRPGDRVIYDTDGNNRILSQGTVAEDKVFAGSPNPTAQGGFGSFLKWKSLSCNIAFIYQLGAHRLNQRYSSLSTSSNDYSKAILVDLDKETFWKKQGDKATLPMNRADDGMSNFETALLSNVEKVNFLKCKSIVLSYSLPELWVKKLGFGTTISASAENVFMITNYSGLDPETIDPNTGVDDNRAYPIPRKYTLSIEFNF